MMLTPEIVAAATKAFTAWNLDGESRQSESVTMWREAIEELHHLTGRPVYSDPFVDINVIHNAVNGILNDYARQGAGNSGTR
jgi:hypothetical protein